MKLYLLKEFDFNLIQVNKLLMHYKLLVNVLCQVKEDWIILAPKRKETKKFNSSDKAQSQDINIQPQKSDFLSKRIVINNLLVNITLTYRASFENFKK